MLPATAEQNTSRRRVRRALGSVPVLVWVVTGLHVTIMAAYSLLYVPYTNPDEAMHHDMVVAWLDGDGLADPGDRTLATGVVEGSVIGLDAYVGQPFVDDTVPPRPGRPTFEDLGGGEPSTYPYPNQMTQHPPLFYALLAGVLAMVPGDSAWAWDQVVGFLRLANVLMLAPLPILAWAAVRPLTRSTATAASAAIVPLLLPGISRIGGSINNDNLLTLLAGFLTVLLVRVGLGDLRARTAAAVGAVTGLALLTKGFALAFPPIVAIAYVVGWRRSRTPPPWSAALIAQVVAFVVGGWWWVRNLVEFGAIQPVGVGPEALEQIRGPEAPDALPRPLLDFVDGFFEEFSRRIVAWLGLTEPPLFPYWLAALIVSVLVVGVGLALVLRRRTGVTPGLVAVCVLPTVLILAMVVYGSYANWSRYLQFAGVQGRYLYPGIIGVAAISVLGWSGLLSRARRWLPLGLLLLAGFAQFMAAKLVVASFWLPPWAGGTRIGELDVAWETIATWSPWRVGVTMLPFLGIAIFGASSVVATAWYARPTDSAVTVDQRDRRGAVSPPPVDGSVPTERPPVATHPTRVATESEPDSLTIDSSTSGRADWREGVDLPKM